MIVCCHLCCNAASAVILPIAPFEPFVNDQGHEAFKKVQEALKVASALEQKVKSAEMECVQLTQAVRSAEQASDAAATAHHVAIETRASRDVIEAVTSARKSALAAFSAAVTRQTRAADRYAALVIEYQKAVEAFNRAVAAWDPKSLHP